MSMMGLKQSGDTIIEVLIAITVVSLVMGGAYVTSNNSLRATRDAQEHADALELAQSEVEQLRAAVVTSDGSGGLPFTEPSSGFCINNTGYFVYSVLQCTLNSTGMVVASTVQPNYLVKITRNATDTFTVKISWNGLVNANTDIVQIMYRIYP